MSQLPKELSYFELRLQELLNTSFPEKASDQKFIMQRSALADTTYEDAFRAGYSIDECNSIANEVLFEGLHFSRFDTIFQVVCHEFDSLMADDTLRPFALKMLPVCEPVFATYELTDDFAYSYEFDKLYTELTGTIAIWIGENGL
ncbi:hypothetical protein SF1_18730 [Sphingobacterium faecium NBRC 15299]|uniref:DUF1896 domain-containing protein n=1 Tax=Sphingobacterium faecium TaxID=34087 RepID=UPI000D3C8B2A|nr:DUF1896 domain-containing protein [Sphingobacterium faecium]PTX09487.1 uncharacterized protein DUF1896 [Sphingobacterium faecium]GEM63891.1 hypothetical protein SF1_18730 [Sphingobacterium faecium NBRC 15299]